MIQKGRYFYIFKKKLFRHIFFSFLVSLLLIISIYAFLTVPMQKDSLKGVLHSQAKTLANSISLVCEEAMVSEDDSFIVEHNMAVIKDNPDIFTITISKADKMVLQSNLHNWEMPEKLPKSYVPFEQKEEQFDIVYSKTQAKDVFHYTTPIIISGIEWGWIHLEFSLSQYQKTLTICTTFLAILVSVPCSLFYLSLLYWQNIF